MYIFFSNDDSNNTYANNKPYAFTVSLPSQVHLTGQWSCGLKEITIETPGDLQGTLLVCSDICEPSAVFGKQTSVLRTIELLPSTNRKSVKRHFIFEDPYYFPLSRKDIDTLTVVLKDKHHRETRTVESLNCVLHFKKG